MEKDQPKEFIKERINRFSVSRAARLCSLALLLVLLSVIFRPASAASSLPVARQQSTGYWQFLEAVTTKAGTPPVEGSIISADSSISEGHSSYSQIAGEPEPQQYIVDCTWSLSAPNGLDRLIPGEMLDGSMTITDQSQYYRTYDGFDHGYAGGSGSIYIDQPYIGTAYTAGYIHLLYLNVGYQQTGTQEGQLAIPNGPGWNGQMGLKAVCLNSAYERVYEWVPPGAVEAIIPEDGGDTSAPPSDSGGLGWLVVVGGAGAVAAAAAAAVAAAVVAAVVIALRGGKKAPPKQPPPPKYILQLSAQSLEVRVGQSAPLSIQAWRITPQGATVPAPEAAIQVSVPLSPAGLVVTPTTGQGTLQCTFSTVNPTQCAQVTAAITASAGGLGAAARVQVKLVPAYELQIGSQDPQNQVLPGGPGLAAWAELRVTPLDPQSPPDALTGQIAFSVEGPNSDWVRCQPTGLKDGLQWVQLNAEPPAAGASMQPGNPALLASCMAGTQRLEARLNLLVNETLVLDAWADGKKLAEVRFNDVAETPRWFFGGITVYFHPSEDDGKVIVPPFPCNLSNPTLQTEPADILQLTNYNDNERSGWFTGDISLREGVDLEQYFGSDLLEKNAQVSLTITVTAESGKLYQSTLTYQLCPTVELAVYQCDDSGTSITSRGDDYINLGALEFVTDAQDYLNIMLHYRRTDWEREAERAVPFGSLLSVELHGRMSDEYKLGVDGQIFVDAPGREAAWRTKVTSARPLLDTPQRRGEKLGLRVTGGLQNAPQHYRFKTMDVGTGQDIVDLELKPLYLYLGLWVVPGQERGTSTAGAAAFVCGGNGKLQLLPKKTPLELSIVIKEPSIVVDDDGFLKSDGGVHEFQLASEPLSYLISTGGKKDKTRIELPVWLSAWKLRYSGLRWSNVGKARFDVLCRFKDAEEGVVFRVNVKENMAEMVAALDANAGALDLTNHEWQTYSLTGMFGMLLARRECRGAIYNAREWVVTQYCEIKGIPIPVEFRKYVCGQYSQRLRRYLVGRRNGTANPETALKMNGFEGCQYVLEPLHDWFGFHLSGTTPTQEPIFIDPWWTQEWNIAEIKDNYGFKMQTARFTAVLTLLLAELALLIYFLWWLIKAAWTRIGLLYPLELSLAEVRVIMTTLAKKWYWHLANILQNLATWYLQTPSSQDALLFDDNLNYARFAELGLFEHYKDNLLQSAPVPAQSVETWPKA